MPYLLIDKIIECSNKIYRGEYQDAISTLEDMLKSAHIMSTKDLAFVHINLALAYFKIRKNDPDGLWKSNIHCIEAMKCGHNTTWAPGRLAMNLERQGYIRQAIEVCQLVLHPRYTLPGEAENISALRSQYSDWLEKLEKKIQRDKSSSDSRLFSEPDKELIFSNTQKFESWMMG
ncbi:MAG: hypothetical protein LHV69_02400 [Elusimicrobia bacterium]|nr:hypothetical protein [Candidatus Obscuribacterium magneticum]MCB4755874.1 hypothetical protein [Candidatus Obscuribacterium magneticum]